MESKWPQRAITATLIALLAWMAWGVTRRTPTTPTIQPAEAIAGLYVLGPEKRAPGWTRKMIERDNGIIGASIRIRWRDSEPEDGVYDWQGLDARLAAVKAANGKAMIRVLPGVFTPEWVYDAGAASVMVVDNNPYHATHGERIKAPVLWDAIYLEHWFRFVRAMGKRYADNPEVRIVGVTGPSGAGELHLAGRADGATWRAAGYTEEKVIQAWEQTIKTYRAAFPCQHLSVAIVNPTAFGHPGLVLNGIVEYCAKHGVGVQGNWLAAKTAVTWYPYRLIGQHPHPVGFQMLCGSNEERFGGILEVGLRKGSEAGAKFVEVYPADVTSANAAVLKRVAEAMRE